jgi:hypothetical protein
LKRFPFAFTSKSKSDLGWRFLSIIETGRFKDYAPSHGERSEAISLLTEFQLALEFCQMEILPGPQKTMRWGVPDGARDPATGDVLHDDLLISAALCAILDGEKWGMTASEIIPPLDPLEGLGKI